MTSSQAIAFFVMLVFSLILAVALLRWIVEQIRR